MFTAPYASAPQGSFAEPPARRRKTVGIIALVAALIAVATSVAVGIAGFQIGLVVGPDLMQPRGGEDLSIFSPVRDWVLLAEVAFWVGTAFGLWAIVQGIVAAARGRGRGAGIVAIVLAGLGPVVFFAALYLAGTAGIGAAYDFGA